MNLLSGDFSINETNRYTQPLLSKNKISKNLANFKLKKPYVCISPYATESYKEWPANYFMSLALRLFKKKYSVYLIGGKSDVERSEEWKKLVEQKVVFNLIGKYSLNNTIAILSQAKMLIGNDSGLIHINAALNKTTLCLYGPTNYRLSTPWGKKIERIFAENNKKTIHKKNLKNSMKKIEIENVWKRTLKLL